MPPDLAQVLNTLAHEIRTPLAVSQGYLKLFTDGRLTAPEDQQRALQQTRAALGVIATLCADMSRVASLSDVAAPVLAQRLDVAALVAALKESGDLAGATWRETGVPAARVATNAPTDVVRAIAVLAQAACDEGRSAPHAIDVTGGHEWFVIRAGTVDGVAALPPGPDGAGATDFNVVRGGKGLALIWATFVLRQHRIQTWTHRDHKASVGFRIPLTTP